MSLIPPVVHDVPTDAIFAAAFAGVAPTDGVIVNYAGVLYIRNAGIWSSVGGMSTTIPSTGTASAPVAGSWLSGQLAIDSSERIWFCTVSGTPGTWVLTDTVGVSTFNTRTGAVTLLKADVTGTGLAPADIAAAPLASPGLTGTPTAPTATALDNSTKLATTAYADAAVAVVNALVTEIETDLGELAPLASPALTGTPTVPTAAPGTNTTQVASTAFVTAAGATSTVVTPRAVQVGGNLTVVSTSTTSKEIATLTGGPGAGGFDLTITGVVAGDELVISGVVGLVGMGASQQFGIDIATWSNAAHDGTGSAVNWLFQSAGAMVGTNDGLFILPNGLTGAYFPMTFSVPYTVQAGDLIGGTTVVLRPFYGSSATAGTIGRSAGAGPLIFGVQNNRH